MGGIGASDAAIPRAPGHRPGDARAGVPPGSVRSAHGRRPAAAPGTAVATPGGQLPGPARGQPTLLLLGGGGTGQERCELPARGLGLLRARSDAALRSRIRVGQLRAVQGRGSDDVGDRDPGVPRGGGALDSERPAGATSGAGSESCSYRRSCWKERSRVIRTSPSCSATARALRTPRSRAASPRPAHSAPRSSSTTGGPCRASEPLSRAECSPTATRSSCSIGGTLLSMLLGLLVLVLGTGRRRALSLVREKTRELSHQALHDALTGLPNRALVLDRAEQMLARVARQPGTVAGALFIDIDGFKHVNDNLGHAAGDRLLAVVGERLQGAVRDQDTVGRLGGDEFVVLVECTANEEALDHLADRLTEALREPVELDDGAQDLLGDRQHRGGDRAATRPPIACCATPTWPCTPPRRPERTAMRCSTRACTGAGRIAWTLEADLSAAVADEQFFLLYQPIFDLASRQVVGVEALVRWQHPHAGRRRSRRLHPAGRGERADRPDRSLGPGRGLPSGRSLDCRRPHARRLRERIGLPARPQGVRRGRTAGAHALRAGALVADARDHRDDADARRVCSLRAPTGDQGARRARRDRRLRHRLRVAVAPAAHAGRHPQDRPELRRGTERRRSEPRAARRRSWAWASHSR